MGILQIFNGGNIMFNFSRMQFNRGTFNSQNAVVTSAVHSYISDTDTLTAMLAPGYFPAFFGLASDDTTVQVGDIVWVTSMLAPVAFTAGLVTALNPIALDTSSDDVFPGGIKANVYNGISPSDPMFFGPAQTAPITIGSVTAPVNIPSVLTANGIKNNIYEGINPADFMFFGNNQTSTITIGGGAAGVFFPSIIITNNFTNTGPGTAINMHGLYDGLTFIGQDTALTTTGIKTNRIEKYADGGPIPLVIGGLSAISVELGKAAVPVIVKGGIKWDLTPDSGTISNYEEHNVSFSWSGPWAASQPGNLIIQKFENTVFLTIDAIALAVATIAGQAITAPGIIPAFARPISQKNFITCVTDNGGAIAGSLAVGTNGDLTYTTAYNGTLFTGLGLTGAFPLGVSYNKAT